MNKYDNPTRDAEVSQINAYLSSQGYESIPEWALDSGYMNVDDDGDDWYDENGNVVDIHQHLLGIVNGEH